jgi:hypothetical protein
VRSPVVVPRRVRRWTRHDSAFSRSIFASVMSGTSLVEGLALRSAALRTSSADGQPAGAVQVRRSASSCACALVAVVASAATDASQATIVIAGRRTHGDAIQLSCRRRKRQFCAVS